MSTRGCIAFGNKEKWEGLYQHSDSYPTYLGPVLLKAYQDGTLKPDILDKHPGGFSQFPDVCYCHDEHFAKRDGSAAKDSPYYKKTVQPMKIDSANSDPLFIEWVYIFDEELGVMHILAHKGLDAIPAALLPPPTPEEYLKVVEYHGTLYSVYSTGCCYYHYYVTAVNLKDDPEEIDWRGIENIDVQPDEL